MGGHWISSLAARRVRGVRCVLGGSTLAWRLCVLGHLLAARGMLTRERAVLTIKKRKKKKPVTLAFSGTCLWSSVCQRATEQFVQMGPALRFYDYFSFVAFFFFFFLSFSSSSSSSLFSLSLCFSLSPPLLPL